MHTPGPWKLHLEDGCAEYITGGEGPNGPVYIATLECKHRPGRNRYSAPGEIAADNARLIAASPDLLEALRHSEAFIVSLLEGGRRPDDHDAMLALRMYRSAIANATGDGR